MPPRGPTKPKALPHDHIIKVRERVIARAKKEAAIRTYSRVTQNVRLRL